VFTFGCAAVFHSTGKLNVATVGIIYTISFVIS